MAKTSIKAMPLLSYDTSSLVGAYIAINEPDGLTQACFTLKFSNISASTITISYDGITDHEVLRPNSDLLITAQMNHQPRADEVLFAKGTIIYVKGDDNVGTLYVSGYYV